MIIRNVIQRELSKNPVLKNQLALGEWDKIELGGVEWIVVVRRHSEFRRTIVLRHEKDEIKINVRNEKGKF